MWLSPGPIGTSCWRQRSVTWSCIASTTPACGACRSIIRNCRGTTSMQRHERTLVICLLALLALLVDRRADAAPLTGRPLPFLMAEDFEDLDFCAWRVEPGKPDSNNP